MEATSFVIKTNIVQFVNLLKNNDLIAKNKNMWFSEIQNGFLLLVIETDTINMKIIIEQLYIQYNNNMALVSFKTNMPNLEKIIILAELHIDEKLICIVQYDEQILKHFKNSFDIKQLLNKNPNKEIVTLKKQIGRIIGKKQTISVINYFI